jgi:hypothetical protein
MIKPSLSAYKDTATPGDTDFVSRRHLYSLIQEATVEKVQYVKARTRSRYAHLYVCI